MQTEQIKPELILEKSAKILELVGSSKADALSVATSLVDAQVAGHSSHGILRLVEYAESVENGQVVPNAQPKIISERGAVVTLDAQWGWGQIACKKAVDLVAEKARKFGIATVTINSCNHIGRLGEYVEMLSKKSLVSIMWCNGGPNVAPFGGKTRIFGTNPFAAGIPTKGENIVIDFATAGSAEGKIRAANVNGLKVPEGLIVKADGSPTIEPADFYAGGAILPFGGHKGYCLNLIIELLGGALSGAHPSMSDSYSHGNGTVLIAMDPEFFCGTDQFLQDINQATDVIKNAPPADPNKPVLLPGEVEEQERGKNSDRIAISAAIWNSILELENQLLAR
ncbi:MAG: Ldh family oxidoreductase [Actinomycetes bacterium]